MMGDQPLLPCPFCGGPARTFQYNGTAQASCAALHTECAGTDVVAPVAMWNRRALSAVALPDELEARLKPNAVVDHVPGLAVSNLRRVGSDDLAERLSHWIVQNNALKAEAHSTIAALRAERDELLYLHSERDQGDKIINERLAALEDGVKVVVAERDSWRRVAERLEGEKQAAGGANAPS